MRQFAKLLVLQWSVLQDGMRRGYEVRRRDGLNQYVRFTHLHCSDFAVFLVHTQMRQNILSSKVMVQNIVDSSLNQLQVVSHASLHQLNTVQCIGHCQLQR
jgi:hypothetical protein